MTSPTIEPVTPTGITRYALISVSDKTHVEKIASALLKHGITLLSTGGTFRYLTTTHNLPCTSVSNLTNHPEILSGRVKTLHPVIAGGILAKSYQDLQPLEIPPIDFVICNLYQFSKKVTPKTLIEDAVEEIDIGGVTLLRAAAKNFHRVTVVSDIKDYDRIIQELPNVPIETRKDLATRAFLHTKEYDTMISDYLHTSYSELRYGTNPHQKPATLSRAPFQVLNGSAGYINLLDALNAWPLVKELGKATGLPAAASFKHVSPSGVAVCQRYLTDAERQVYMVPKGEDLSDMATAYVKARGCDRMSSYGDFIALSQTCDASTARFISREVSDGVIAPGYETEALEIFKKKKNGRYLVLQMDPNFEPPRIEEREVYGVRLTQRRNDATVNKAYFSEVHNGAELSEDTILDLTVATIALKFTQSNSVCFAKGGMTIGIGAGQQSRLHCTRLAAGKAKAWWGRFHPEVMAIEYKEGTNRAQKSTLQDQLVTCTLSPSDWSPVASPSTPPTIDFNAYNATLTDVVLSSDAFFPFPDSLDVAATIGTTTVAAPMGSVMDAQVLKKAEEKGMNFVKAPCRLFHH